MTDILKENPPNYDEIVKNFRPGKHVVFAYAPNIYNPNNLILSDAIVEHEKVHLRQQRAYDGGADAWWKRYIEDPRFRLKQEYEAHHREYMVMIDSAINRQERRSALRIVAKKLASPLYGKMLSPKQAQWYIKNGQYPV